ncbi:effector-associated constant component EACC1 [Phytohabitans sp. LJ34]|uniref:effector-associated constant component EACC1 n=1 Tax=Phytohabitans sp. LJ34 TaxID=3452217 RepID=UPI003F8C4BC5
MNSDVRVYLAEDGADAERIDALTGYLRQELRQLDVRDVSALRGGAPPPGTRGFDVAAVGALLVTLGESAVALSGVVTTIRAWLGRGAGTRRTVRIEIGGDVLELSEATASDQDRLVALFVSRHTGTGGGS